VRAIRPSGTRDYRIPAGRDSSPTAAHLAQQRDEPRHRGTVL